MEQAMTMIWLYLGIVTLLYLLFWPFSLRVDARLSPTSGRGEVTAASFLRLRLEGDFLQPPWLRLYVLDGRGRRRLLGNRKKKKRKSGFRPVIRDGRIAAVLCVGTREDGALTVEALGLLYALLETLAGVCGVDLALTPTACFDKNICALRLSGIGRFVLAQNILNYLKGKHAHANR